MRPKTKVVFRELGFHWLVAMSIGSKVGFFYIIAHVNNISTSQSSVRIPRKTQQKLYMRTLTEYAWEFQSDALWDTLYMPYWVNIIHVYYFLYSLWQDERKRFEKTTKGFCAAMDKHLGLKPAKSGETQIQDVSKPIISVKWETGQRYVVHVNCTVYL